MTSEKTAADMLRELLAGMTPYTWKLSEGFCAEHQTTAPAIYAKPSEYHYVEVVEGGCDCGDLILSPGDARGIVALVNAAEEIAALVEAVGMEVDGPGDVYHEYEQRKIAAYDALTAKLRGEVGRD